MVNWVLTRGMQNLLNQINAWAPDRDKTSDGTIGDYAHTQEKSGHNPDDTSAHNAEWDGDSDNVPEVRAIDIDANFRNGISAQKLVDHIVGLKPSSVLRYVIYNRRIWEAKNDWNDRPYDGASAHTEHIHFSGAYTDASDNNSTYNFRLEEIDTMTPDQFVSLLNNPDVRKALCNAVFNTDNVVAAPAGAGADSVKKNPYWAPGTILQNTYNAAVAARDYAAKS